MGKRAVGVCAVVAWHKNWMNSDANSIVPGVVSDATDYGIGGIATIDCGGNGIDAMDCAGNGVMVD